MTIFDKLYLKSHFNEPINSTNIEENLLFKLENMLNEDGIKYLEELVTQYEYKRRTSVENAYLCGCKDAINVLENSIRKLV